MRRTASTVAVVLFLLGGGLAKADPGADDREASVSTQMGEREITIRAEKVAPGIFFLHSGAGGNMALCIGEDGAFLVDDQYAPLTDAIRQVIGQLTDEPVRFVLNTHWHGDHTGGIRGLLGAYPGTPVYGPANERIPAISEQLGEGDRIRPPGLEQALQVLDVPGHTAGHIAYLADGTLLCGDTLFAGGCGRLFEGTPEQMHRSLSKLAGLAPATRVCCAHEYTEANLLFAREVEPGDAESLVADRQLGEPLDLDQIAPLLALVLVVEPCDAAAELVKLQLVLRGLVS